MPHLADTFERVAVINLNRRPERLARFRSGIDAAGWPFRPPEVFDAIDGRTLTPPPTWQASAGAYGCAQSHAEVIRRAMADGVASLLILEDDAYIARPGTFGADAARFLSAVPADWDALFLGGEHLNRDGSPPPGPVASGVVRCHDCERSHAYALRGPALSHALEVILSASTHKDRALGLALGRLRTYAAEPFLIGQDEGVSDINGQEQRRRLWRLGSYEQPDAARPWRLADVYPRHP
jgi:hypothetical protein